MQKAIISITLVVVIFTGCVGTLAKNDISNGDPKSMQTKGESRESE